MSSQVVTGSYLGTGASLAITKIGFKPRHLILFNQDDAARGEYFEGMPDAALCKQKAGTTSYVTSAGVTLSSTGFTIGTDTDLNVVGERVWFVAHE